MRIGEQFGTFAAGFRSIARIGKWLAKVSQVIESQALTFELILRAQFGEVQAKCARFYRARRWVNPWSAFVLFLVLLLWRNHWWISEPQFYIEDGPEFYGRAFDFGSRTLFETYMGYFHLIPRIVALTASQVHPRYGPIFLELAAITIQAAVAAFFLSRRLRAQVPSLALRFLMGFLVVAYPYSNELASNIAHTQWYLAIGSVLIICARPGRSIFSRVVDYVVIGLNALTGPFSLVLAPLAWYMAKPRTKSVQRRPNRRQLNLAIILTIAAVWTGSLILRHPRLGVHGSPRLSLLDRMLSSQVVIGSTYGLFQVKNTKFDATFNYPEFIYALFCVAVMVYGVRHGSRLIKAFSGLAAFTLVTSLYSGANWIMLGNAGVGERYFFVLGLLFVWSCYLASVCIRPVTLRWLFRYLIFATCVGIAMNWVYRPPFPKFDYAPQIATYDRVPPGTHLMIKTPIDRKSDENNWVTQLVKKWRS